MRAIIVLLFGLLLSGVASAQTRPNATNVLTQCTSGTPIGGTGAGNPATCDTDPTLDSLTFSPTTKGIVGTPTNDNAAATFVGEYISSTIASGSPVSLVSATATNVTSISLTAGDWEVSGNVGFVAGATTTMTWLSGWASTASATYPTPPNNGSLAQFIQTFTTGQGNVFPVGVTRISVSTTTTVYLSVFTAFAVSTLQAYGHIHARRVR